MRTGKLALMDNVEDSDSLALHGTFGVASVRVDGRLFVFAAGERDDGITVLELLPDGGLIPLSSTFDTAELALDDVNHFAIAEIGGQTFLYANAQKDNGISVFRVGGDGSLSIVEVITDNAETTLGGTIGEMETVTIGSETFLLATGEVDSGLTVFHIDVDGRLKPVSAVLDEMFGRAASLGGARGVTTATVDDTHFAIVAGFMDSGIAVFEMGGQGELTHLWSTFDAVTSDFKLNGVMDVASTQIGGVTYVFGAGAYDDGISSFRLGLDGKLFQVAAVSDGNGSNTLNGAEALEIFATSGETFLAVAAFHDDAISIFHIDEGGGLTEVSYLIDTHATEFAGPAGLSVDIYEGRVFIIAGGLNDNGISALELGGGDDVLTGTLADDLMFGFAGNDTISGSPGLDTIAGGAGRDVLSYAMSSTGVSVDLGTGTGRGGDARGDVIREIEVLAGSAHGDTLTGGVDADWLLGEGGDDFIFADGTAGQMTAGEVASLLEASATPAEAWPDPNLGLYAEVDPLFGL